MKTYLFFVSIIFAIAANVLFVSSFMPSCGPKYGTGLDCEFVYGSKASISEPAKIDIYGFEPFTIGYLIDGEMTKVSPPSINDFYALSFVTSGPIEIVMLQSAGGIDDPYISVDAIEVYPTLQVSRTWYMFPVQISKWYMFPVYLILLAIAIFFYALAEIDTRASLRKIPSEA